MHILCRITFDHSVMQVLSYDGLHPPDALAVTAAGIAVYDYFFCFPSPCTLST